MIDWHVWDNQILAAYNPQFHRCPLDITLFAAVLRREHRRLRLTVAPPSSSSSCPAGRRAGAVVARVHLAAAGALLRLLLPAGVDWSGDPSGFRLIPFLAAAYKFLQHY